MPTVIFKSIEEATSFKNKLDENKISYTKEYDQSKDRTIFYTEGYRVGLERQLEAEARSL